MLMHELYDICMCLISMNLCCLLKFEFLENFQKPPSGLSIAARGLIALVCFWVPLWNQRWSLYRQATQTCNPFLGSLMKGLAEVFELSGDANQILVRFWCSECCGMTLIGGKANFNGLGVIGCQTSLKFI